MRGDGRIFKLKKRGSDGELHELPYWHVGYYGPSKKGDGKIVEYRESAHSENRRVAESLLRDRRNAVANHRAGIRRFVPRQDRILVRELTATLIQNYETRSLPSLPQARANVRHLNGILGDDFALSVNRAR
ncbi:MAG: hypothetical protein M3547_09275, partial [Acidobacteriota bacterium]|nr:hypothetical protein [Acidobacteriota bacterium]